MCPKKCVTPHSGNVANRTDFLANSKKSTCKKRLKVEGGSSPIRPGPHRVQRTDLPYFCGEVRNRCKIFPGFEGNGLLKAKVLLMYLFLSNPLFEVNKDISQKMPYKRKHECRVLKVLVFVYSYRR
ncbi:hypothetical protein AVEN_231691-1 [Araneus ventricosus]|uniref:Uncharacterized protein n=1 Tax=Araneus ventricosus TaxID=182803 RepID=A0A4Y2R7G2_ARAVE|nr:hypothetical protein AVEN_50266-1 [Araneus ventricosus]GBN71795.1 hypothetical protein AVEN_231691-1 [Araneus ventricosus]